MLAIGNDELNEMPRLGITVKCWKCGKMHRVLYGDEIMKDGIKKPSRLLAFFKCHGKLYFCGINGKEWRPKE